MNIAGKDGVGVVKYCFRVVCKDDFNLCTAFADKIAVIFNIVNSGELVAVFAEKLAVFFKGKYIGIGVNSGFVDLVEAYEAVAHLVGGIAEHKHDFLCAGGNSAQANGEAVTGKNGENNADGAAAELFLYILCNGVYGSVVALCAGGYGLGDGDNIAVVQREALGFGGFKYAFGYNGGKVVSLTDDGAANSPGNGADSSCILFHF